MMLLKANFVNSLPKIYFFRNNSKPHQTLSQTHFEGQVIKNHQDLPELVESLDIRKSEARFLI